MVSPQYGQRGFAQGEYKLGCIIAQRYRASAETDENEKLYDEAIKWHSRAAKQEFAEAQQAQEALEVLHEESLKRQLKVITREEISELRTLETIIVNPEEIKDYAQKGEASAKEFLKAFLTEIGTAQPKSNSAEMPEVVVVCLSRMIEELQDLESFLKISNPKLPLHQKVLRKFMSYYQAMHGIFTNRDLVRTFVRPDTKEPDIERSCSFFYDLQAQAIYTRYLQSKTYAEVMQKVKQGDQLAQSLKLDSMEASEKQLRRFAALELDYETADVNRAAFTTRNSERS